MYNILMKPEDNNIMKMACGSVYLRSATTGHGIDCDCDDSCLEYICDSCGYQWSANRNPKDWECDWCGKKTVRVW